MAKTKTGTVVYFQKSSSILGIFRLMPESGSEFPAYKAGQYIALRRDDCRMTKKIVSGDGKVDYETALDAAGNPKRGSVTHSYSIASAPFETREKKYLEFYVVLETDDHGLPGRLTESIFRMDPENDNRLVYFDKIAGDFTLDKRAGGVDTIVMVGTGTGIAPFVSMVKQLDFEAADGKKPQTRYTLIHANRTYAELDYRADFEGIAAAGRLDFVYLPSVSRPTARDLDNRKLGKGRANNLLRAIFAMPLKEEGDLEAAREKGGDVGKAQAALEKTVRPVLPAGISADRLRDRMDPKRAVLMTCGNPGLMADIEVVAGAWGIRFEKEDW
jgi:ferredoxin-NADP reductase